MEFQCTCWRKPLTNRTVLTMLFNKSLQLGICICVVQNLPGWLESIWLSEWNKFHQVWSNVQCSPTFHSWLYLTSFVLSPLGEIIRRHNMNFQSYADDFQVYFWCNSDLSVRELKHVHMMLQDGCLWTNLNLIITRQSFWSLDRNIVQSLSSSLSHQLMIQL